MMAKEKITIHVLGEGRTAYDTKMEMLRGKQSDYMTKILNFLVGEVPSGKPCLLKFGCRCPVSVLEGKEEELHRLYRSLGHVQFYMAKNDYEEARRCSCDSFRLQELLLSCKSRVEQSVTFHLRTCVRYPKRGDRSAMAFEQTIDNIRVAHSFSSVDVVVSWAKQASKSLWRDLKLSLSLLPPDFLDGTFPHPMSSLLAGDTAPEIGNCAVCRKTAYSQLLHVRKRFNTDDNIFS
ncbi:hypothetical protein KP509_1Z281800 [Ceratopteris richardii]|nr:hypothetical protein KP509_1Z281800 [Ceratopteris richardii]